MATNVRMRTHEDTSNISILLRFFLTMQDVLRRIFQFGPRNGKQSAAFGHKCRNWAILAAFSPPGESADCRGPPPAPPNLTLCDARFVYSAEPVTQQKCPETDRLPELFQRGGCVRQINATPLARALPENTSTWWMPEMGTGSPSTVSLRRTLNQGTCPLIPGVPQGYSRAASSV